MAASSIGRFGPLLRHHRLAAGLSQEELAERAGLSARGISALESGHRPSPRLKTVRLLADALGLDAAARAELNEAARPELAASTPPASVAAPVAVRLGLVPPPLPVPATRIVGRQRELAEIKSHLDGGDREGGGRLLTLTAPGDVGKTRLALAAARELAPAFADGAAWVELVPLRARPERARELVASAIAQALAVPDAAGQSPSETLLGSLPPHELLLVLDNFEHLPAAPLVAELLAARPRPTVPATSRERLHLRGEHELAVEPLAVPPPPDATGAR